VIRSFKKNEFNLHYDFSLIFTSTDEAVRHILKSSVEEELPQLGAYGDADNQDVFPDYVYKARKDNDDTEDEDDRPIQERF
jgi:hypothetical protein